MPLTTTSYVVLGLLARRERTAYDVVHAVRGTLGHVWRRGERALYDEPARLVAAGYVTATTRKRGRRAERQTYAPTDAGRAALSAWLATEPGVHHVRVSGSHVGFTFTGSDEAQAELVTRLIGRGLRLRTFEEKRSSFEDILVEVAENNRRS